MKFRSPFESKKAKEHQRKIPTVEEYKSNYEKSGKDRGGIRTREHTPEEAHELWQDLNEVGNTKALGYLPIDALIYVCRVTNLEELAKTYREKGLKAKFMQRPGDTEIGNLYVWDETLLQRLLTENKELLNKENWPITPEAFVDTVNEITADTGPLYDLIARAYNDPRYRS